MTPDSLSSAVDEPIRQALFALLDLRADSATVCPSEVARRLRPDDAAAWRALMPAVRLVASQLAAEGLVVVTRQGVGVDALARGGPIRIGRGSAYGVQAGPQDESAAGAGSKPGEES